MSGTTTCEWCAEDIPPGSTRCPKCQGSIRPTGRRIQGTPLASAAPAPAKPKAPAGWYDDPKLVNTRRYWDGQKWTEHRLEKTAAAPPDEAPAEYRTPLSTASTADKETRTLFHWGIAMMILLPIIGFIIGMALLGKKPTWGVRVIIGSIMFAFIYYTVATGISSGTTA